MRTIIIGIKYLLNCSGDIKVMIIANIVSIIDKILFMILIYLLDLFPIQIVSFFEKV